MNFELEYIEKNISFIEYLYNTNSSYNVSKGRYVNQHDNIRWCKSIGVTNLATELKISNFNYIYIRWTFLVCCLYTLWFICGTNRRTRRQRQRWKTTRRRQDRPRTLIGHRVRRTPPRQLCCPRPKPSGQWLSAPCPTWTTHERRPPSSSFGSIFCRPPS